MTTFAGGGRCRENLLCTPSQLEPREPKRARKSASPETDEPTATACLTKQEVVIVRRAITSRYDASVSAAQHAIVSETEVFRERLEKSHRRRARRAPVSRRLRGDGVRDDDGGSGGGGGARRVAVSLESKDTPNDSFTVSTMEPRPASSVARRLFVVRREKDEPRVRVVSSSFATNTADASSDEEASFETERRAVTVSRGFVPPRQSSSSVVDPSPPPPTPHPPVFQWRGAGERRVVGAQPLGGGVRVAPRAQNVHAVQPGRRRGRGRVVRAFVVRASVRALIDRVSTHGRRTVRSKIRGLTRFGRAPLTPAERLAENARQRIRRGRLGAPRLRVVLVRLGSSPRSVRGASAATTAGASAARAGRRPRP